MEVSALQARIGEKSQGMEGRLRARVFDARIVFVVPTSEFLGRAGNVDVFRRFRGGEFAIFGVFVCEVLCYRQYLSRRLSVNVPVSLRIFIRSRFSLSSDRLCPQSATGGGYVVFQRVVAACHGRFGHVGLRLVTIPVKCSEFVRILERSLHFCYNPCSRG